MVVLEVGEGDREVVRVPAESRVVEVDDVQRLAVFDDVVRMQVGVDEAEGAMFGAVGGEDAVDGRT